MKEKINLSPYGHAESSQIKELIFDYEGVDTTDNSKIGVYKVHAEWPDNPNLGTIRMGYNGDEIQFIDFDGGPFLTKGSKIDNYTVVNFSLVPEFPIKIMLREDAVSN